MRSAVLLRPEIWLASPAARDSKRAQYRLFLGPRRGGGGRRDPCNLCHGTITMLIIGILLNVVGLGIFCWALFALAIHALPFFVGMTVGIYSSQAGAGPLAAIVVGFVTAGFTLVVGQFALSVARSPIVRVVIGLLFAVPAATRRLWRDACPCTARYFLGRLAGIIRFVWRHRCWEHCLGWCIDADRSRPQTGCCSQPYAGAAWSGDYGRVTARVCRLSPLAWIGALKLGSSSLTER
ncbi:hypothetical protein ACVWW1_004668 [Bradyrhizobium sp. JR3.5]